ncbi:hypothetical protein A0H81_08866 [Grifola frondosa]|uniref:Uncharacterized protein n=1 Tax=Grifola frondosa TaxID=5627 RepID=A0A1C7M2Z6_GRIFR|nr:hypothetical protein A0H81_08866 [Grifola frondosa]
MAEAIPSKIDYFLRPDAEEDVKSAHNNRLTASLPFKGSVTRIALRSFGDWWGSEGHIWNYLWKLTI